MPFFDIRQINDAVRFEALPALERFVANPRYRRFERDELPAYVSSESEDEVTLDLMLNNTFNNGDPEKNREFDALIDPPLNEDEQARAAALAHSDMHSYSPGECYLKEARWEDQQLSDLVRSEPSLASAYLTGPLNH